MSDTLLVGALSLLGTLIGSVCGILSANRLTNYRIKQLEMKVDKHNTVVERMYKAEQRLDVVDEQIRVGRLLHGGRSPTGHRRSTEWYEGCSLGVER